MAEHISYRWQRISAGLKSMSSDIKHFVMVAENSWSSGLYISERQFEP
jgi:2-phospho-L-lactate transferase/gluconeogenesis factor (CofD/UPF0052 family)